jgi:hypothetical protein
MLKARLDCACGGVWRLAHALVSGTPRTSCPLEFFLCLESSVLQKHPISKCLLSCSHQSSCVLSVCFRVCIQNDIILRNPQEDDGRKRRNIFSLRAMVLSSYDGTHPRYLLEERCSRSGKVGASYALRGTAQVNFQEGQGMCTYLMYSRLLDADYLKGVYIAVSVRSVKRHQADRSCVLAVLTE